MVRPSKPTGYTDRVPPLVSAYVKVKYGTGAFSHYIFNITERSTLIDRAHSLSLGVATNAIAADAEIEVTYLGDSARVPVRIGWQDVTFDSTADPVFTESDGGPSDLAAGSSLTWPAEPTPDPPEDPEEPYVYSFKDTFVLWRKTA
jgi:hypothetical protein